MVKRDSLCGSRHANLFLPGFIRADSLHFAGLPRNAAGAQRLPDRPQAFDLILSLQGDPNTLEKAHASP